MVTPYHYTIHITDPCSAATCSGGNPEVGNKLAELLVPNMDEKVDPAMMAALMSACSMINAGAGTEEVRGIQ